ncbi:MAG: phosphoribosyl-AMP cyclohydrolase [Ferrimicrobium sp.]|uniref:phosphoribosyl-AMP cyclohydrolase n=1 Tax=Ferrimicrobium sp. TaxID=2926050 RepID=UPI0026228508|nr:phosphoribosyl-AMP cyclohydrolase [Ferrimicrobium sp.]
MSDVSIEGDEELIPELIFDSRGLMPAIVVDEEGQVLMLAWVDQEALRRMLRDGETWFYSRSRQEYWHKGATSGNIQEVLSISVDCDADTLLIRVHQHGQGACHTGTYSCFSRLLAHRVGQP